MSQTYTKLLYHIVFSTKKREPWIPEELRPDLHAYIGGILRNRKGQLLAAGGMPDHMHLLARLSADRSISDIVRDMKVGSSTWFHERGHVRFQWQAGYGAFSLDSSDVSSVKFYIEHQAEHHANRAYCDEYVDLLVKHEIAYDQRYLWE